MGIDGEQEKLQYQMLVFAHIKTSYTHSIVCGMNEYKQLKHLVRMTYHNTVCVFKDLSRLWRKLTLIQKG